MGGVGLVTCILTITLVLCMKLYKHFIYRLAMYKVISSMLVNFFDVFFTSYLLTGHVTFHHVLCSVTGFLVMYCFWINLLFTVVIVFHFFSLAVCLKNFKRLEVLYVLFAVLLPLLFMWIPFIDDNYGPNGALCWIKDTTESDCSPYKEGIIEQYTLWYGPSYFILLVSIVAGVVVIATLFWRGYCRERKSEEEALLNNHKKQRKALVELIPLLFYPAIFLFFNLFAIAHRIVNAIPDVSAKTNYNMALTHSIVMTSWGILSSLALLLLLAITRSNKERKNRKVSIDANSIQHNDKGGSYTTYNVTSTTQANTTFTAPTESEVEKRMEQ